MRIRIKPQLFIHSSNGGYMKLNIFIDREREEEVIVYVHEKNRLIEKIERLVLEEHFELIGYKGKNAVKLEASEIYCFTVEDNKVYAVCEKERLQLKCRLYQLEELTAGGFVKINQSCIANIRKIKRFDASISGALKVIFKNGYTDYVSRRQMKSVKERLGL